MQNPMRRPRNHDAAPSNRDLERQRKSDGGVLNKGARGHLVAMAGEFAGTVMFLYFAFAGTQIANTIGEVPSLQQLLFISLSFGFSLAVTAWSFYRISGGLFNPAVRIVREFRDVHSSLTFHIGNVWHGYHRHPSTYAWSPSFSCPDARWYGRCRTCCLHVPWAIGGPDEVDARHLDHAGAIYRNVRDRRIGFHHPDVGCREEQSYFHSPRWNRSCIVRCRAWM